jgi:hypothetical protein
MLILTQSFHPLLLIAIERGMTAAWLVTLLASLVITLAYWPIAVALRRIPRSTVIDLAQVALGRPGAILAGLAVSATFLFMQGMILRETSEMAITAAFPHTPQTFATVSLLLGSMYIAYGDSTSLVRLGRLMLPAVVAVILLILVGSWAWGQWRNVTPFWGPGPVRLALGVPQVAVLFAPATAVGLMTDRVRDRKELVPWILLTPLIAGGIVSLETLVITMIMPYPASTSTTFPLYAAARIIVAGRFFERLEGLWLFMWVWSTIVLSGVLLYGASAAIARAFAMPRHTFPIVPLATVAMTVAFFSRNQADTITLHERGAWLVFAVTALLPALLAPIALYRYNKGARP